MYKLTKNGVIRLSDNAIIPECVENADWIAYQIWLSEGNTPETADAEPAITTVSAYEFLNRFTQEERIAIRNSTDAYVQDFISLVQAAQIVDFSNEKTLEGMVYLVTLGWITEARKTEILS